MSAQIRLPVRTVLAHQISPALLALDTEGGIGLRTLSEDNIVEWHAVEIVGDDDDGAWVTGLPDVARVITVGQELVVAGDEVDAVYEQTPRLPTANQRSDAVPSATESRRTSSDTSLANS